MGLDFKDRAVLVTGSAVGIGRATAIAFAKRGATVAVHYRNSQQEAEQTATEIESFGGRAILVGGDIGDEQSATQIVESFVAETGRLDVLVNNAGEPIARSPLEECETELWLEAINTNLTGTFLVTRSAIKHLRNSDHAAIINNLSLSVQTGGAGGAGPYAAAKGGIQVMTRTLARELAPRVRTNAVMPGVIETRHHALFTSPQRMAEYRTQTPQGRNGTSEEVASAIVFLASDEASFINGATLDINGGRFLR